MIRLFAKSTLISVYWRDTTEEIWAAVGTPLVRLFSVFEAKFLALAVLLRAFLRSWTKEKRTTYFELGFCPVSLSVEVVSPRPK